jgi:uncharacterized membrane protein YfcA
MTRQARLAWVAVALTVALGAVHTWFFVGWPDTRTGPSWPILTVGAVLMTGLGALVVARRSGHRIGWLFVLTGLSVALSNVLSVYEHVLRAESITVARGPDVALAWVTILLDLPFPALVLILTFLLFPTGHVPSPRWRYLAWAAWTTFALFVLLIVLYGRPENVGPFADDAEMPVPFALGSAVLVISILLELVAAAVAVFLRLRRASSEERQQLRWLVAAAAAVAVGLAVALFGDVPQLRGPVGEWFRLLPLYLGVVSVPVAAGLAILRYRLYDIDILLNRALVLTCLTAFVATGYVAVVVVIGAVVGQRVEDSFWPSLLAFVLVALAFQPVRRFVLRLADRLVYGRRAAPYEALADFSSGVSHAPSPDDLLPLLAETVGRSVHARRTSVSLELPGTTGPVHRSAAFPPERSPQHPSGVDEVVIDVRDRDDKVAQIRLDVERPLTADQWQLANDLGQQAAIALRNLRLEAELADRVEQLVGRTAELERSRRGLVAARDDERHRLAGALQEAVVAHLESMPADLGRLAVAVVVDPASVDAPVALHIEAAGSALTELRTISRGLRPRSPTPRPAVLDRTPPS